MKAFVVLSSDFKNKEQDEMIKELQDHVTKKTAAWVSPRKVGYVLFTKYVYLFIYLFVYLFVYLFIYLFIYLTTKEA